MIFTVLIYLYFAILVGIALYGFNALIMSGLFLRYWNRGQTPEPPQPANAEWPRVTVQLPIFNERFVVERLIDTVAALDYPLDKLSIQVLDDSTDETIALARTRVAIHQARGVNITYLRRSNRQGFKAGALAYALPQAEGEFIAIFDADFSPKPDYLKRVIPHFADPQIGMVQTRWGHLNAESSALTRAQAIALDGHFVVEQTARSRSGLLFNFNGSGGMWRKACIEDAGGWQADTIAEDLDLSYRAQLKGWRLHYLPNVVAPAEIPPLLTAYKRQQFRWAKGSIQCLGKFGFSLLNAGLSPWKTLQAYLHLSGYMIHFLILAMVLVGLPVILVQDPGKVSLGALGLAGFAPPILFALSQWAIYPNWKERLAYFPVLVMLGAGVTVSNTWAIVQAMTGRNATEFLRTPKFRAEGQTPGRATNAGDYNIPVDWTTWAELLVGLYCLLEAIISMTRAPGLTPFLALYAAGYLYTSVLGLWQSGRQTNPRKRRARPKQSTEFPRI